MFCPAGKVVFIYLYQVDKTCLSLQILAPNRNLLSEYKIGVMESVYPKFAPFNSKMSALELILSSSLHLTSATKHENEFDKAM